MGINNKGSFESKLRCIIILFCALFIFVFFPEPFPQIQAQSTQIPIDVNNTRLTVVGRSKTGLTVDAGEFYRVDGRKVRLLRSLEKVVVRYTPDQKPDISKRVNTRQVTGRPFVVEQEQVKEKMLVMRTSGMSSLAELDETINQIQREPDISQVTPVYINEETGLETISTDQFIVKIAPEVTLEQLETFNKRMGITLVRRLRGTTDQFILRMDTSWPEGLLAMCETYSNDPIIVWASPNFLSQIVYDSFGEDNEYLPNQWHLEMIEAAKAWDVNTGEDIVVAVFDNGVDIDHEDLRDSFPDNTSDLSDNGYPNDYYGWDFHDNDPDPRPSDPVDNHGTAVAGVIAARGNNNVGVLGCAYNCTLMSLKLSAGEGEDAGVTDAAFAEAIRYAAGFHQDRIGRWRGADVINMSFHTSTPSDVINEALHKAATEGREGKGCPIFCSSGNDEPGWIKQSISFPKIDGDFEITFKWEYRKNALGSDGEDTMWLDQVIFPDGTEESFEGDVLPAGWISGGNSKWISVQNDVDGNHALTGWNGQGSRAVRSGPLGNNGYSYLEVTKIINLSNAGPLIFSVWPSSETGDKLRMLVNDNPIKLANGEEWFISGVGDNQENLAHVAYPASHPDTIAVGASTDFDYRADYSQYGFGLDFVAPSGGGSIGIATTDRTDEGDSDNYKGYAAGNYNTSFSGTSAASPLAAAVGALMLSANPNLTAEQVRDIMQDTCEQIGNEPYSEEFDNDPNTNIYYGHGRINAEAAVNAAARLGAPMVEISGTVRSASRPGDVVDEDFPPGTLISNATITLWPNVPDEPGLVWPNVPDEPGLVPPGGSVTGAPVEECPAPLYSVTSDDRGVYQVYVPYEWSGRIVASEIGYSTVEQDVTNTTMDQEVDFDIYRKPALIISGYVSASNWVDQYGHPADPISGAMIKAVGTYMATSKTDLHGYYSMMVPYEWSGYVEASGDGYWFSSCEAFDKITADANVDFRGFNN